MALFTKDLIFKTRKRDSESCFSLKALVTKENGKMTEKKEKDVITFLMAIITTVNGETMSRYLICESSTKF